MDGSRRKFIKQTSIAGTATDTTMSRTSSLLAVGLDPAGTPAILCGVSVCDKAKWTKRPIWIPETDEKRVLEVLQSGVWLRNATLDEFESKWSKAIGVKRSLTLSNGTNAIIVALPIKYQRRG